MKDAAEKSRLGAAVRSLRRQRGWTLAELSRRSGFSVPTLSKVENDRLSLSYDKLIRLSEGLGIDIGQLFVPVESAGSGGSPTASGRRSVNREGEGELVSTQNYDYRYLCTDVTRKKFIPILTVVHARSLEEFGALVRHSGEEFVYVLEGLLEIHTEHYAPMFLKAGESAYLDSSMGHAYVAGSDKPCRLMAVCSAAEQDLREAMGPGISQPRRKATRAKKKPRQVKRHR